MHHPETEKATEKVTEDISANPHSIYKVIKNAIGMVVMFGACIGVCHLFGWI